MQSTRNKKLLSKACGFLSASHLHRMLKYWRSFDFKLNNWSVFVVVIIGFTFTSKSFIYLFLISFCYTFLIVEHVVTTCCIITRTHPHCQCCHLNMPLHLAFQYTKWFDWRFLVTDFVSRKLKKTRCKKNENKIILFFGESVLILYLMLLFLLFVLQLTMSTVITYKCFVFCFCVVFKHFLAFAFR